LLSKVILPVVTSTSLNFENCSRMDSESLAPRRTASATSRMVSYACALMCVGVRSAPYFAWNALTKSCTILRCSLGSNCTMRT
jgi:hypothetical protein